MGMRNDVITMEFSFKKTSQFDPMNIPTKKIMGIFFKSVLIIFDVPILVFIFSLLSTPFVYLKNLYN